ncbi:MAG: winged helix-turn-helix domain-containing protein [Roseibacillus sp.]
MSNPKIEPTKNQIVPDPAFLAEKFSGWTFLTNHTHVIVCLSRDSALTVRSLALQIGITERSVQRILAELEEGGVVQRTKDGRCNLYSIDEDFQLRHPLESHHTVADLLKALK